MLFEGLMIHPLPMEFKKMHSFSIGYLYSSTFDSSAPMITASPMLRLHCSQCVCLTPLAWAFLFALLHFMFSTRLALDVLYVLSRAFAFEYLSSSNTSYFQVCFVR